MKGLVLILLLNSCASTPKDNNPAILCPDASKSKVLFCNCFVEAKTLEGNKSRYLYIPCPSQDGPAAFPQERRSTLQEWHDELITDFEQVRSKEPNGAE